MEYHFKNLVFEGGGVKGIAYVGALEALEKRGILKNIERVGGTSAGAITAILVGLKFSMRETTEIMNGLDFNRFMDNSMGIFSGAWRLIYKFGWYKGDFFRDWIGEVIKQKTGNSESTFKEIHLDKRFRDLYLIGTNLSTRFGERFSHEATPEMAVADAVRISMSIPLFFAAKRRQRGDVYVDGGVLNNYPVKLFDNRIYVEEKHCHDTKYYKKHNKQADLKKENRYVFNKETLGFRLDSKEEIAVFRDRNEPVHRTIDGIADYIYGLVETILTSQQNRHLHGDDWHRTIYIDTKDVGTIDFDLSDEKKEMLITSGNEGVTKYFDDWYDSAHDAANRPAGVPVSP